MLKRGVLFYKWIKLSKEKFKLVVPDILREEVLYMVHDSKVGGHFGEDQMLLQLKSSFLWYNMGVDCRAYVRSCTACSRNKKLTVRPKGALGS